MRLLPQICHEFLCKFCIICFKTWKHLHNLLKWCWNPIKSRHCNLWATFIIPGMSRALAGCVVRNAATSTLSKQKFRFQIGPSVHWVSLHDRRCRILHLVSHLVELHFVHQPHGSEHFGTLNSTKLSDTFSCSLICPEQFISFLALGTSLYWFRRDATVKMSLPCSK